MPKVAQADETREPSTEDRVANVEAFLRRSFSSFVEALPGTAEPELEPAEEPELEPAED